MHYWYVWKNILLRGKIVYSEHKPFHESLNLLWNNILNFVTNKYDITQLSNAEKTRLIMPVVCYMSVASIHGTVFNISNFAFAFFIFCIDLFIFSHTNIIEFHLCELFLLRFKTALNVNDKRMIKVFLNVSKHEEKNVFCCNLI